MHLDAGRCCGLELRTSGQWGLIQFPVSGSRIGRNALGYPCKFGRLRAYSMLSWGFPALNSCGVLSFLQRS